MSPAVAKLRDELVVLQAIHGSLATNEARKADLDRHALVKLRRQLSEQLAVVKARMNVALAGAKTAGNEADFNRRFSEMRTALALHQSNWSAVEVDHDNLEYRRSVERVQAANRGFTEWALKAVGDL